VPEREYIKHAKCFICEADLGEPGLYSSSGLAGRLDDGVLCETISHLPKIPAKRRDDDRLWFGICDPCVVARRSRLFTFEGGQAYPVGKTKASASGG